MVHDIRRLSRRMAAGLPPLGVSIPLGVIIHCGWTAVAPGKGKVRS